MEKSQIGSQVGQARSEGGALCDGRFSGCFSVSLGVPGHPCALSQPILSPNIGLGSAPRLTMRPGRSEPLRIPKMWSPQPTVHHRSLGALIAWAWDC